MSRPETSPASIKESSYKLRSQSRLHERSKEQSYNMKRIKQDSTTLQRKDCRIHAKKQILSEESSKFTKVEQSNYIKPNVGNHQNIKYNVNQISQPIEKDDTIISKNLQFAAGNRRKNTQRNRVEILTRENRIDECQIESHNLASKVNGFSEKEKMVSKIADSRQNKTGSGSASSWKQQKTTVHEIKDRPTSPKTVKSRKKQSFQKRQNSRPINDQNFMTGTNDTPNNNKFDILKLDEQDKVDDFPEEKIMIAREEKSTLELNKTMSQNNVKTSPNTPQTNNRYSKGIKARIAQLFTNKTAVNTGGLDGNQETLMSRYCFSN